MSSSVSTLGLVALLALAGCDRPAHLAPAPAGALPTLTVQVLDGDAAPVADAWVTLAPSGRDGLTQPNGVVTFDRLSLGEVTVLAAAQGQLPQRATVTLTGPTQETTLTLPPEVTTARLRGTVSDPSGAPAAGVGVWVDAQREALTDADGAYLVEGLDAGAHDVLLVPPDGMSAVPWRSNAVSLTVDGEAEVAARLAGRAPETARYVGSDACTACHAQAAADHVASAHYRPGLTVAQAQTAMPALAQAFADELTIPLGATGGWVTLGQGWTLSVTDSEGVGTPSLAVDQVYGGYSQGVALAVLWDGARLVAPVAMALPGEGVDQAQARWVGAWTDAWFDDQGAFLGAGGQDVAALGSWTARCEGCHATGHAVVSGSPLVIGTSSTSDAVEDGVGCEACHGPGSAHLAADTDASAVFAIVSPQRLDPTARAQVCVRCHSRSRDTTHPFGQALDWPVTDTGDSLGPLDVLADNAMVDRDTWLGLESSRAPHDQAGDFALSAHHQGPDGYNGACGDCHLPHGGPNVASLRASPDTNDLCIGCHARRFPDDVAQAVHTGHERFEPGPWSPGRCTGCHMPRAARLLRADPLSGAGDLHDHTLWPWSPDRAVAVFDDAGLSLLPLGDAPVSGCLDCHLQADAVDGCTCPKGSPERRGTHEGLLTAYLTLFGGAP